MTSVNRRAVAPAHNGPFRSEPKEARMFKKVLVPTDGSDVGAKAASVAKPKRRR